MHYTRPEDTRVPNQPATRNRNFRCPDPDWDDVLWMAADRGETATDIILLAIRRLKRDYPAITDPQD